MSDEKYVSRRDFLALSGLGMAALAFPELARGVITGEVTRSMSTLDLPAGKQPNRPYILSPYDRGYIIEDVWPMIYFGDEVVPEIKRKVRSLAWAKEAVDFMKQEAEVVVKQPPQLPVERAGWRHDFYSRSTAEHLLYDHTSGDKFLDPSTGISEYDEAQRRAWVLLTHERTFRMMRSLGILYRLTGDERYSEWIADGMRKAVDYFTHHEFKRSGALYFQPLYDAAVLSMLGCVYSLNRESAAYTAEDHTRIKELIFEERMPSMTEFLEKHPAHNMSCYVSSALAYCGKLFDRKDWIETGVGQSSGLRTQLEKGVRTNKDGQFDGFWFEGTMFYHFYSLCPLVTLWEMDKQEGGKLAKEVDLRERFIKMLAAPVALADEQLRLPVVGDLGSPVTMNLAAYRHLYEYAAGQLDPEFFGPVLSAIYARSGAKRLELTALAFGPDELPEPGGIPKGHTLLPVAKIGVFRSSEPDSLYVAFRAGKFIGGHDHPDRLNIIMHAYGRPITPDLGTAGYSLHPKTHNYYLSTLAHNTLFADEKNQTGEADLDWRPDADPPRARGVIINQDGIRYQRTVFYVRKYIILLDEYESDVERRFGWAYHAYGDVSVSTPLLDDGAEGSLKLPPLPDEREYLMFTDRKSGTSSGGLAATWNVSDKIKVRVTTVSDGTFEATYGKTPGQPLTDVLGCLLLRAPGTNRRFATVIEPYENAPSVESVSLEDGKIFVKLVDGTVRSYTWE